MWFQRVDDDVADGDLVAGVAGPVWGEEVGGVLDVAHCCGVWFVDLGEFICSLVDISGILTRGRCCLVQGTTFETRWATYMTMFSCGWSSVSS